MWSGSETVRWGLRSPGRTEARCGVDVSSKAGVVFVLSCSGCPDGCFFFKLECSIYFCIVGCFKLELSFQFLVSSDKSLLH